MAINTYEENGKKLFEIYVNGLDSAGRRFQRRKRGIETLKKAQAIEFEMKRDLAKAKDEPVEFRWEEWLKHCVEEMKYKYRPSTYINYECILNKWMTPLWKGIYLSKISKSDIYTAIYEKLNPKLTLGTRKTILKMVRRVFQMAVEEGVLDRNPCSGVQVRVPEVEQKVLTNAEVTIFLREAQLTNHRFYPVWALALLTGMRSGELFALKKTDIDFDAKIISVNKQWTSKNGISPTKTQRSRVVPISDDLAKFLKELWLKSGDSEHVLPRLIEWENGEQARITREFCQSIGVTSIKFHDLRATFITNLLSRGVSLARVMAIVGHSQLKTTNGYLRRAGVEVKGATDELGYSLPDTSGAKILSIVND